MGRLRDFGWWLRDHTGGIALLLALLACGAGAAGIVIALDARDKAESDAADSAVNSAATVPPAPPDSDLQGTVDELNERVAAIEESVASLREEGGSSTTTESTTTPEDGGDTTAPELPELPEGVEIPGLGQPESEPSP